MIDASHSRTVLLEIEVELILKTKKILSLRITISYDKVDPGNSGESPGPGVGLNVH
jgi:hypothetical protein